MNNCPNCGKVMGLHSSILQGCMCQYSMQAPPQRTWVGLTEQDLDYLCNLAYTGDEEFALAVQAKLMEKNA
jgi:hypothetical protein